MILESLDSACAPAHNFFGNTKFGGQNVLKVVVGPIVEPVRNTKVMDILDKAGSVVTTPGSIITTQNKFSPHDALFPHQCGAGLASIGFFATTSVVGRSCQQAMRLYTYTTFVACAACLCGAQSLDGDANHLETRKGGRSKHGGGGGVSIESKIAGIVVGAIVCFFIGLSLYVAFTDKRPRSGRLQQPNVPQERRHAWQNRLNSRPLTGMPRVPDPVHDGNAEELSQRGSRSGSLPSLSTTPQGDAAPAQI